MTISIGSKVPEGEFKVLSKDGMTTLSTGDVFDGKTVALFALPGAFTPTCSQAHVPGFVMKFDDLKAAGVDSVACLSVNDAFVMSAWQQASNAENLLMLADGEAIYTKALGLDVVIPGMGTRSKRFSMLVIDGVVKQLNIEEPGKFEVSDAETLLKQVQ